MFTQVSVRSLGEGGVPSPFRGIAQSWPGEYSRSQSGGIRSQPRGTPVLAGGTPVFATPSSSQGGRQEQDWGTPAGIGIPTPKTEQQSGYLLRGGRYASCGQAGGISCSLIFFSVAPTFARYE